MESDAKAQKPNEFSAISFLCLCFYTPLQHLLLIFCQPSQIETDAGFNKKT